MRSAAKLRISTTAEMISKSVCIISTTDVNNFMKLRWCLSGLLASAGNLPRLLVGQTDSAIARRLRTFSATAV